MAMPVHQCTRLFNNLCLVHKRYVRRIANYLKIKSTYVDLKDASCQLSAQGIFYSPNKEKFYTVT